jgi:hypothetical protein
LMICLMKKLHTSTKKFPYLLVFHDFS